MTLKNAITFSLNQLIESLIETVKNMKNRLYSSSQPQRKRAYNLEAVLTDWEIDPENYLMIEILRHLSHTSVRQEKIKDVEKARGYLFLYIRRSRKGIEFDELVGGIDLHPYSRIKAQAVIEDWDLPYRQGCALEFIYQSLFEYGERKLESLQEAENILFDRLMLRKKNKRAQ